ncbi:uncharacterized protein LOC135501048 [Lineus longissimus]|uniref:uncharacterized protein LOC135501048 n=1 Tax=Lineus longissimus TaxID=88925 RepID=UPI002B4E1D3C
MAASENSDGQEIRKALFRSPAHEEVHESGSSVTETLINKVMIDYDIESSLKGLQKDLHDQRLKQLKGKLKDIAEDNWRYPSIDKLIGIQT